MPGGWALTGETMAVPVRPGAPETPPDPLDRAGAAPFFFFPCGIMHLSGLAGRWSILPALINRRLDSWLSADSRQVKNARTSRSGNRVIS
jgi:hypothetical protein